MATKPFDEKHPLNQRLVAMLLPPRPEARQEETDAQRADAEARERAYARARRREFNAWRRRLSDQLSLKKAALAALPGALRVEALREDLVPFPLARNALFDAPPSAYLEEEEDDDDDDDDAGEQRKKQAAKKQQPTTPRGRG